MSFNIFNFLEQHIVQDGQTHTHTSMFNPKQKYFIKSTDLNVFYELYEKSLFEGNEMHITEKKEEISPIVIDLDFKYEFDTFDRKHNESYIEKIILLYINEICGLFDIEKDDNRLTSFIFERDEIYKSKGITKDGIHILFPFINSNSIAQYHIRDNILKKIGDITSDLGLKNTIPDIVDRTIISPNTCWLLYGSNKDKPKGNPYKLKYIFDGNSKKKEIEEYFNNEKICLTKFFSIRDRKESELTKVRSDKLSILDVSTKKKLTKIKQITNINYDPEKIKELVSILNIDRANNYAQWIEVGWLLHNIDPNSQELLDIWIEFSKKSDKFEEGACEKVWQNSKNEGFTIGTLHYWAKIDNYHKYIEFKNKDISKYVDISIKTKSNYDIAFVLFKLFEYDFIYSNNEWYIYKNHRWHKESDGMSLRQLISTKQVDLYSNIISKNNQLASSEDTPEEEKEEYKAKNKEILEITKHLKTTAFKENIMKECKELFFDKDFVRKLDENHYLIGFSNGVYDLKKGELRVGRPDDYIEMSTEIEKIEFDENNDHWEELKNFIDTIFYEEDIRTYFLTYFASCLQGHNAEEKFRIWTGIGCHAFDSEILMFNKTIKKVQDITIGDKLMGDDNTERNVLELKRGKSDMYNFFGNNFEDFTVNGEHILCLVNILTDVIIEVSVKDYLQIEEEKENYYLYNENNKLFNFTVKKVKDDNYYGFEIDKNHRYIMGNGIITHNSNGKSKILELFVHCLGMYSVKFPITMLIGKRAASNACTPELARSKGKRFGYLEEPSENEELNAGFLKELTGNDKLNARGLYKESFDFKPQFKLALLCNEVPKVPPNDSGTWRRLEVIEFKSKFCEHPKESHEFPIDKYLSEKMKNWKELFMALLTDVYYVKYKKEGIKVPSEVIKFTLEYQKQCDLYTDFILENLEDTKQNSESIDINQLYDEFKIWYEETFSNHKYPSKIEFKKYLRKKYTSKRVTANEIKGFKFKLKYEKDKIKIDSIEIEDISDFSSYSFVEKNTEKEEKEKEEYKEFQKEKSENSLDTINNLKKKHSVSNIKSQSDLQIMAGY